VPSMCHAWMSEDVDVWTPNKPLFLAPKRAVCYSMYLTILIVMTFKVRPPKRRKVWGGFL